MTARVRLEGVIAAAGFASGDRFVIGAWERGPLGPMTDVMWQRSDDRRILVASSAAVADFVGSIYRFEETRVDESLSCEVTSARLRLRSTELEIDLVAARPMRLFSLRPKRLRRSAAWVRIEDALFRPIVARLIRGAEGVRTFGVTPGGQKEWYPIDAYQRVIHGRAVAAGRSLGDLKPVAPPVTFGFSAFPAQPALVRCAPLLEGVDRKGAAGNEPADDGLGAGRQGAE